MELKKFAVVVSKMKKKKNKNNNNNLKVTITYKENYLEEDLEDKNLYPPLK